MWGNQGMMHDARISNEEVARRLVFRFEWYRFLNDAWTYEPSPTVTFSTGKAGYELMAKYIKEAFSKNLPGSVKDAKDINISITRPVTVSPSVTYKTSSGLNPMYNARHPKNKRRNP